MRVSLSARPCFVVRALLLLGCQAFVHAQKLLKLMRSGKLFDKEQAAASGQVPVFQKFVRIMAGLDPNQFGQCLYLGKLFIRGFLFFRLAPGLPCLP